MYTSLVVTSQSTLKMMVSKVQVSQRLMEVHLISIVLKVSKEHMYKSTTVQSKIYATDDGINASEKATNYDVQIEINGGNLDITMAEGDTDALDSNGTLTINGGNINITAQFAFDFDLTASLNGGTVTVNGTQVTSITNSMMEGGGGPGGQGGFGGPR